MRAARRAVKEGFPLKRIVLTGGGTAGHVTPNLALIPRLQRDGWDVHYIGTRTGIERSLVEPLPGVTYHAIQSGKLRRYFDLKNFTDHFRVVAGAFQAQSLLGRLRPAVVFAKGGFVSVPVVYGAALHRIPVLVHESDITPGLANKLSAPFASAVLTTFPEAARAMGRKGVCTGTPLRPELFAGDRARGLALCAFDGSKPAGERIVSVTLEDGTTLDLDAWYTLACNDFMCGGGDGYTMLNVFNPDDGNEHNSETAAQDLPGCKLVYRTNDYYRTVVSEYIKAQGSIAPALDGRITILNPQESGGALN